ncbi:MAG: hypothetical protein ABSB70_01825 [Candidatus Velthaea sp.]
MATTRRSTGVRQSADMQTGKMKHKTHRAVTGLMLVNEGGKIMRRFMFGAVNDTPLADSSH